MQKTREIANVETVRRSAVLGLVLLALIATAQAAPVIACQPAILTPCLIADTTGVVTVTNPAQLTFAIQLGSNGVLLGVTPLGEANASYFDSVNLFLAANPYPVLAQNAANLAALKASGMAPFAPNPGGSEVTTNSTTSYVSGFVDTPVAQQVNQYQTTIRAVLNGTQQVYQMTFAAQFSDPAVQAAILAVDKLLSGSGASFSAPLLLSNNTSLTGTQTSFTTTGKTATGATLVGTTTAFGPTVIAVGDNQSNLFTVLPGQLNLNVNVGTFYNINRNAVTTSSFLTTQLYEIDGTSSSLPTGATPEPGTLGLLSVGLFGIALKNRKS